METTMKCGTPIKRSSSSRAKSFRVVSESPRRISVMESKGIKGIDVNEEVLNGTILLILVTCVVSSFITESAARKLALELHHAVVIQGPMMSDIILKEAGISHTDASIAVTSNDKDNLLASMLASQSGVSSTVAVVNTPSYNNLIANIGDNILIDRSSVIISKILKEIRKTKIHKAYSLNRGQGEMWEIVLDEENQGVGRAQLAHGEYLGHGRPHSRRNQRKGDA